MVGTMQPQPFKPVVTIETSHDVRRVAVCTYCRDWGMDMPIIAGREKRKKADKTYAHTFCIVTKGGGFKALAELPDEEVDKTRAYDFLALGLTLDQFNTRLLRAALP